MRSELETSMRSHSSRKNSSWSNLHFKNGCLQTNICTNCLYVSCSYNLGEKLTNQLQTLRNHIPSPATLFQAPISQFLRPLVLLLKTRYHYLVLKSMTVHILLSTLHGWTGLNQPNSTPLPTLYLQIRRDSPHLSLSSHTQLIACSRNGTIFSPLRTTWPEILYNYHSLVPSLTRRPARPSPTI